MGVSKPRNRPAATDSSSQSEPIHGTAFRSGSPTLLSSVMSRVLRSISEDGGFFKNVHVSREGIQLVENVSINFHVDGKAPLVPVWLKFDEMGTNGAKSGTRREVKIDIDWQAVRDETAPSSDLDELLHLKWELADNGKMITFSFSTEPIRNGSWVEILDIAPGKTKEGTAYLEAHQMPGVDCETVKESSRATS
ncbi:hypothetical protein QFC20_002678 [Naganishia adeliensis]|uniref:Uncharacterized protein n=1 Tax=Naganishia adeliensis TaxID=92952 RepID=A0ACC2WIY7_9TREE|nr:hypothetical protein QFC20_002678 [Naganishia adeliensis]